MDQSAADGAISEGHSANPGFPSAPVKSARAHSAAPRKTSRLAFLRSTACNIRCALPRRVNSPNARFPAPHTVTASRSCRVGERSEKLSFWMCSERIKRAVKSAIFLKYAFMAPGRSAFEKWDAAMDGRCHCQKNEKWHERDGCSDDRFFHAFVF